MHISSYCPDEVEAPSPNPLFMVKPITRAIICKPIVEPRMTKYLHYLYPKFIESGIDANEAIDVLHEIVTTCFIYDLHNRIINDVFFRRILVRVVTDCCYWQGAREFQQADGDEDIIDMKLLTWLTIGEGSVEIVMVSPSDEDDPDDANPARSNATYTCRSIFDYWSDSAYEGGLKEQTKKEMDKYPRGAIFLPAYLFYGSDLCSSKRNADRTVFDTLLVLTYFRELCRAVAVWAGAAETEPWQIPLGYFSWGFQGRGRLGNTEVIEYITRELFIQNNIVPLASLQSISRSLAPGGYPGDKISFPRKKTTLATLFDSPYSSWTGEPILTLLAHYGTSNLPDATDSACIHDPISVTTMNAELRFTLNGVYFPGKHFTKDITNSGDIYAPDFRFVFGPSHNDLYNRQTGKLAGIWGEIVDVSGKRHTNSGDTWAAEGPWEALKMEWRY